MTAETNDMTREAILNWDASRLQIIIRNGNEDAVFQLGGILESHFRGYVRCSSLDR